MFDNLFNGAFPPGSDVWEDTALGMTFRATLHRDDDQTPPWERSDGHGPVSEWTSRAKRPGERVLVGARSGRCLYYGFQEAVRTARRDGWGSALAEGTPGQRARDAAEADFDLLRRFCADLWGYVGVCVTVSIGGVELTGEYAYSLWGVESAGRDYMGEVVRDLAGEAFEAAVARAPEIIETLEKVER